MIRLCLLPLLLALACFATTLTGCDGCGEGAHTVPFKRDTGADTKKKDAQKDAKPDPSAALPDATVREHDGGPQLELGEQEVSLPGARASLEMDLNADGFVDALVWAGGEQEGDHETPLSLWHLRGEEDGYAPPQQVARSSLTLPERCVFERGVFERLSNDKAGLITRIACQPDEPAPLQTQVLLLGLSATPRVLERVALRGAADPAAQTKPLSFARLAASDDDGDGHTDLQLVLDTEGPAGELSLTWLDRPSGLARESNQPEAALEALASSAAKQLDEDSAAAERTANAALRLYRQLCREAGAALLSVSDVWGLRCSRSKAAGFASLVRVRALAAQGQLVEALGALDALDHENLGLDASARQNVVRELEEKATTPAWKLEPLPALTLPAVQPALGPSIRLVDGGLWVGTQPPRMWNLASRQEVPGLSVPDLPSQYSDPSGRYQVRHVDRDCQGRLLRLAASDGSTVRARITEHAAPPGCNLRLPVPDAGDLRVMGWAPQGVVLSDAEGALLVPLDAQARPTEAPRRLEAEVPLPAPLPAGRAAPSGRCYVRPTAHGVLILEHGRNARPQLVRPDGWASLKGPPREAVVDSSCKRLAVATQDRIYLIERRDAPTPAPASPAPATPVAPL